MKKIILLILVSIAFTSCEKSKAEPIEKYKGKSVVVVREPIQTFYGLDRDVRCKNKDSIFYITISDFDAKNLKVGDTL